MQVRILFTFLLLSSFICNAQTVPVFENGLAQDVPGFSDSSAWIKHDLWVETDFDTDGDGKKDRMHVAVIRPAQTDSEGLKLPVIYNTSPYFAGVAPDVAGAFWDVNHEIGATPPPHKHPPVTRVGQRPIISTRYASTWIPKGYIMVYSSSPGTGLSDGSPTVGGINESLAPKAVIEWLTGKPNGYTSRKGDKKETAFWSTGKVGMTGTSYNGTLPLAAATTGVEGLEVIIPVAPNTSYYHYYRSNGLVRSPGGYLGEDVDVLYDFIHSGEESKRAYSDRVYRDSIIANGIDRLSGDYNDFWYGRDYLNQMENMSAAMLMSHGFNDWNVMPEHSYRIYDAAKKMGLTTQIYYHQDGHGGPPPKEMMNKWFSQYLFGRDNGIENEVYKAHIVRENETHENPTKYLDYPNPDAEEVRLYFNPNASGQGALTTKQTRQRKTESFTDDFNLSSSELIDPSNKNHRLLFISEELTEDVHLSGLSQIKLKIAASKAAANLSVYILSLPFDKNAKHIQENLITRGWADPQNSKGIRNGEDLIPNEFVNLSFYLQPDDHIVKKGQQIGLMIFSSDQNFTLHPEPGTEITIDLSQSSLTLPVVGGKSKWNAAQK